MAKVSCIVWALPFIVACDAVGVLFSFEAKATQNKVRKSRSILECENRSQYVKTQVAIAIIFVIVSHCAINLVSILSCFDLKDETSPELLGCRKPSLGCLIFTWLSAVVIIVALATKSNENQVCNKFIYGHYATIGGIVCIFHAAFGLAVYFTSAAFHHNKYDS